MRRSEGSHDGNMTCFGSWLLARYCKSLGKIKIRDPDLISIQRFEVHCILCTSHIPPMKGQVPKLLCQDRQSHQTNPAKLHCQTCNGCNVVTESLIDAIRRQLKSKDEKTHGRRTAWAELRFQVGSATIASLPDAQGGGPEQVVETVEKLPTNQDHFESCRTEA